MAFNRVLIETSIMEHKYIKNPDLIIKEVDEDGALIYNPDTDQVKLLNPTGLFIINECDGRNTQENIHLRLAEAFDGLPEQAELHSDIESFLNEMVESGFIGTCSE